MILGIKVFSIDINPLVISVSQLPHFSISPREHLSIRCESHDMSPARAGRHLPNYVCTEFCQDSWYRLV